MHKLGVVFAAAACTAAAAWWILSGDTQSPPSGHSSKATSVASVGQSAEPGQRAIRTGSKEVSESRSGLQVAAVMAGPSPELLQEFSETLDSFTQLLVAQLAASDDEISEADKNTLDELRSLLVQALKDDVLLTDYLLNKVDESEGKLALHLANVLAFSDAPALPRTMSDRLVGDGPVIERRVALRVLEGKAPSLWLKSVEKVYLGDSSADVRDDATGFLVRSLADKNLRGVHKKLRKQLQSAMDSDDPSTRVRGVRTMLGIQNPSATDLAATSALLDDPDDAVRKEAGRTLRILNARN